MLALDEAAKYMSRGTTYINQKEELSLGLWVQDLHTIGTAGGHETESADAVATTVQQKLQRRLRRGYDSLLLCTLHATT